MKHFNEKHLAIVDQQSYKIMKNAGINKRYTRDDLVSTGMEALLKAYETYDPSKDIPFEPYAANKVRFAMLDEMKLFQRYCYMDFENLPEEPAGQWDEKRAINILNGNSYDWESEESEFKESLYRALDTLTDDEMHLVELRLGLNGYEKMKLRELSSIMHISNEAVNKRVHRIFDKLKKCA